MPNYIRRSTQRAARASRSVLKSFPKGGVTALVAVMIFNMGAPVAEASINLGQSFSIFSEVIIQSIEDVLSDSSNTDDIGQFEDGDGNKNQNAEVDQTGEATVSSGLDADATNTFSGVQDGGDPNLGNQRGKAGFFARLVAKLTGRGFSTGTSTIGQEALGGGNVNQGAAVGDVNNANVNLTKEADAQNDVDVTQLLGDGDASNQSLDLDFAADVEDELTGEGVAMGNHTLLQKAGDGGGAYGSLSPSATDNVNQAADVDADANSTLSANDTSSAVNEVEATQVTGLGLANQNMWLKGFAGNLTKMDVRSRALNTTLIVQEQESGNASQAAGTNTNASSNGGSNVSGNSGNGSFGVQSALGALTANVNQNANAQQNANNSVEADMDVDAGTFTGIMQLSTGDDSSTNQSAGTDTAVDAEGNQVVDSESGNDATIEQFAGGDSSNYNAAAAINNAANGSVGATGSVSAVDSTEALQVAGNGTLINQDFGKTSDIKGEGNQDITLTAANIQRISQEQGYGAGFAGLAASAGANYNADANLSGNANAGGSVGNTVMVGSLSTASALAGEGDLINQTQGIEDLIDADGTQTAGLGATNISQAETLQAGDGGNYNSQQSGDFDATTSGELVQGTTGLSSTELTALAGDGGLINQNQYKLSDGDVDGDQVGNFISGNTTSFRTEQGNDTGTLSAGNPGNYNAAADVSASSNAGGFAGNSAMGVSTSVLTALAGQGNQINQNQGVGDTFDVDADQSIGSLAGNVTGIGLFQYGDEGQYNADSTVDADAHSGIEVVQGVLGGSETLMTAVAGDGGQINQDQNKWSDIAADGDQIASSIAGNTTTSLIEQGDGGATLAVGDAGNYNASNDFTVGANAGGSVANDVAAGSLSLLSAVAGQGDLLNQSQDLSDLIDADGDQNANFGAGNTTVGLIAQAGNGGQYNADQTGSFGAGAGGDISQSTRGRSESLLFAVAGDEGDINQDQSKWSDGDVDGDQTASFIAGNTTTFITEQGEAAGGTLAAGDEGNYNAASNVGADAHSGGSTANTALGGSFSSLSALAGQGDLVNQSQKIGDTFDIDADQDTFSLAGNVTGVGVFQNGGAGQYNAESNSNVNANSGIGVTQEVRGASETELVAVAGSTGDVNQDQTKLSDVAADGDQTARSIAGNTTTAIIDQGDGSAALGAGDGGSYNASNDFTADANSGGEVANDVRAGSLSALSAVAGQGDLINQSQSLADLIDSDADQNASFGAGNTTTGLIAQSGDNGNYNADQSGAFNANAGGAVGQETVGRSESVFVAVAGDGGDINQNQYKDSDIDVDGDQDARFVAGNTTTFITEQGENGALLAAGDGNYNAESDVDADANAGGATFNAARGGSRTLLTALAGQGDLINQRQGVNDVSDVDADQNTAALAGNVTGVGVFQNGSGGNYNAGSRADVDANSGIDVGQEVRGASETELIAVAGDGGYINQDQGKWSDISADGDQVAGAVAGNTTTAIIEQGAGSATLAAGDAGNYNAENDFDADANAGVGVSNDVRAGSRTTATAVAGVGDLINQRQRTFDAIDVDADQDVLADASNETEGLIVQGGEDGQYNAAQSGSFNANAGGEVAQETIGRSETDLTAVAGDNGLVNQDAAKSADIDVDSDQDAAFIAGNNTTLLTIQGAGSATLAAGGAGNYNAATDVGANANAGGSLFNRTRGGSRTGITQVAGEADQTNQVADLADEIDVDGSQTGVASSMNTTTTEQEQLGEGNQYNADLVANNNANSNINGMADTLGASEATVIQVAGDGDGLHNLQLFGTTDIDVDSDQDISSVAANTGNYSQYQGDAYGAYGAAAAANGSNYNASGDSTNNANANANAVETVNGRAKLDATQVSTSDQGAIQADYDAKVKAKGNQDTTVGAGNTETVEQEQGGENGQYNADYGTNNTANGNGSAAQGVDAESDISGTHVCAGLVCALRSWVTGNTKAEGDQDTTVASGNANTLSQEQDGENGNYNADADMTNNANGNGTANQNLGSKTKVKSVLICDEDVEVCAIGSRFDGTTETKGKQNLAVGSENVNTVSQKQGDEYGVGGAANGGGGNYNADLGLDNTANSNGSASQTGNAETEYDVTHDCGGSAVCAAGAWVTPTTRTTLGQNAGSMARNNNVVSQNQEGVAGNANANIDSKNTANANTTASQNGKARTKITGTQGGCGADSLCAFSAVLNPVTEVKGSQGVNANSENNGNYEQEYDGAAGRNNQKVDATNNGTANAVGDQNLNAETNITWTQDCGSSKNCGQAFDENSVTKATGNQNVTANQQNNTTVKQKGGNGNQSATGNSTSNATTTSTNTTNAGNNITLIQQ
jgi:trimeric autotransporter adhesin